VELGERLRAGAVPAALRVLAVWPHDLYLAWISVAVIANSFQYAHVVGFGGFGIAEATWAVAMMGVATALGAVMAYGRGNWLFPLVVAWALRGIGARHAAVPAIADVTAWLVPAGVVLGVVAWGGGGGGGGGAGGAAAAGRLTPYPAARGCCFGYRFASSR
jgi:hypothetical protein